MQQSPSKRAGFERESTANYPESPTIQPDNRRVTVEHNGVVIADSSRAHRVLQRGLAPAWYFPPEDVRVEVLDANDHLTHCGYKGDAHHYDIVVGESRAPSAAWSYPEPKAGFEAIQYAIAFYPSRVDACTIDGERVRVIEDDTSGGWITTGIDIA